MDLFVDLTVQIMQLLEVWTCDVPMRQVKHSIEADAVVENAKRLSEHTIVRRVVNIFLDQVCLASDQLDLRFSVRSSVHDWFLVS